MAYSLQEIREDVRGLVAALATLESDTATAIAALPQGVLGYAAVTANQTTIGTGGVDLTGLAVTVSVGTSRRIRVSGYCLLRSGTAATNASLQVKESTTVLVDPLSTIDLSAGSAQSPWVTSVVLTPSAGSHTYKLTAVFNANTNNETRASATNPAFILVEDLGPA